MRLNLFYKLTIRPPFYHKFTPIKRIIINNLPLHLKGGLPQFKLHLKFDGYITVDFGNFRVGIDLLGPKF